MDSKDSGASGTIHSKAASDTKHSREDDGSEGWRSRLKSVTRVFVSGPGLDMSELPELAPMEVHIHTHTQIHM